jgi:vancomycin permeability regulator SanA
MNLKNKILFLRPNWRNPAFLMVMMMACWFLIHTAISVIFGLKDDLSHADIIVVFGNKVRDDGVPSDRLRSRLDRAKELYDTGYADYIVVSGGMGKEGHDEATVMMKYLADKGVKLSSLITDMNGYDTYNTAKNVKQIMTERGFSKAILVSQYYHISRARMAFRKFGINSTYHACAKFDPEIREPFILVREFLGYYYYFVRKYK